MNKLLYPAFAAMLITAAACGDDKKADDKKEDKKETSSDSDKEAEPSEEAMALTQSMDLSEYGLPFTIMVPEGSEYRDGKWDKSIQAGPRFEILISTDMNTVAEQKEFWKNNDANKLKQFIIDEPNGILAETEVMGKTEYHFYYTVEIDGGLYCFENAKGLSYTKAEAMAMYNACKSVK